MKMVIGKQTAQETTALVSEEVIKKSQAKAVIGEERLSQEMEEMKSKRGRRSKFYSDGKNRMKAEFYEKAIHILNCAKNEYEDIDLRFKDDGEILTPKANCFQSKFYKNLNNGKIFEMEKDLCKIGLKSLDIIRNKVDTIFRRLIIEYSYLSNKKFEYNYIKSF